jgi:hypothetical protein
MAEEKVVVTIDSFEVSGFEDRRNYLVRQEKTTEDLDDLLLKVIDAPTKDDSRRIGIGYGVDSYIAQWEKT